MEQAPAEFPERYFGDLQPNALPSAALIAQFPAHKRAVAAFIRTLPQGAGLLDIGCGGGKTAKLIHALRPDVRISGMDITDLGAHLPPYVAFKQGSVDDLAAMYEAGSFDAVICQHVIEHLVNPIAMIEGIRTILKKGGKLYVETPNWTRLFVPFSHLYFWADYTHIHPYSVTTMHRLCSDFDMNAEIRTVSSCRWFPPRAANAPSRESRAPGLGYDGRGPLSRAFVRLVNPLLRDILIVVAER